jgi:SAM-dependent methyltransferase
MRNRDKWQPSKFVMKGGRLAASDDPDHVAVSSRMITDLVARSYAEHLGRHCRGRLLDLGCGHVPLFQAYRPFTEDNVCVDWANSLHKNDFLDYECDLREPLPFPDKSFDTIILSDVLEHLPEPQRLWDEMARVLRPDGKVLLNVPYYYCLHEEPHDYFRYTKYALDMFAANSGFRTVLIEPIGGVPEILADILAKNLRRVKIVGRPGAIAVQRACQLFLRTGLGRKVSRGTADQFPLGYFMVATRPHR